MAMIPAVRMPAMSLLLSSEDAIRKPAFPFRSVAVLTTAVGDANCRADRVRL
ncbi:hypothetical protein [Geminicoccus sp.]|uniref:hypothetical protein n=1 Tax=Geminicoccus sp. TaxID=2024832 RepID=UPI002D7F657B|nr:hypothetical protein [Geminicoccus sp.]